jgi:hypothetical protein
VSSKPDLAPVTNESSENIYGGRIEMRATHEHPRLTSKISKVNSRLSKNGRVKSLERGAKANQVN